MILLVDIGNNSIKWVRCDPAPGRAVSMSYTKETLSGLLESEWKAMDSPGSVMVSNVAAPETAEIVSGYARNNWGLEAQFLSVSRNYKDLVNAYTDIGQMGVDRWMAMVAGWSGYDGNLCIVDIGTAVTIDIVLADGRHLGGYILPGLQLMQELLNRHTCRINVEAGGSRAINPGISTGECLQNGANLVVTAIIERVVHEQQDRYGREFRCIITGGGAAVIGGFLAIPYDHDPDLVLKGMAIVTGVTG